MKRILIVEDDSFLNKMLAYNLTADGYGVTYIFLIKFVLGKISYLIISFLKLHLPFVGSAQNSTF